MAGLSASDGINHERSKSAAATAEDDGVDHIGFETPRSGVATPQPDLHDKRLPGIMSYFGQVRRASSKHVLPGSLNTAGAGAQAPSTTPAAGPGEEEESSARATTTELKSSHVPVGPTSRCASVSAGHAHSLLPHEKEGLAAKQNPRVVAVGETVPYPTPPTSQRSSVRSSPSVSSVGRQSRDDTESSRTASPRKMSFADFGKRKSRTSSVVAPMTATVTEFSAPATRPSTAPSVSTGAASPSGDSGVESHPSKLSAVQALKKLTRVTGIKSGAASPTRALSTARPSKTESRDDGRSREKTGTPDRLGTRTPTPPGAQAPAAKGKLTIKIIEARSLRKCRDPYVVVVFQRSELISGGPHPPEEEEDNTTISAAVPIRSTLMQRQGSDSGRPPMAIPMRSRQSSNTSITDYTAFRNRNSRRSFTNPKWDAEAVL